MDVLNFDFPFINIVKIDAIENTKFSKRANVHSFPTWVMAVDGDFIEIGTGAMNQEQLIKKIKKYQY